MTHLHVLNSVSVLQSTCFFANTFGEIYTLQNLWKGYFPGLGRNPSQSAFDKLYVKHNALSGILVFPTMWLIVVTHGTISYVTISKAAWNEINLQDLYSIIF